MKAFIKVAVVLGLLLALMWSIKTAVHQIDQGGYKRASAEAAAALEKQKREASQALATEKAKTLAAEQALQRQAIQQEYTDAKHQTTVKDLSSRLRLLAGRPGGLRDPNAPGCGGGSGGATGAADASTPGGAADPAQTGGLLSVPLVELLQRAMREADDINVAYASCRADAYAIRAALPAP